MAQNKFTNNEIILCTYIAMYGENDFSIKQVNKTFKNMRTIGSYMMKVQNIAALLDLENIQRSGSITPLTGNKKGEEARRTNWEWIEPVIHLPQKELLEQCMIIIENSEDEKKGMNIC